MEFGGEATQERGNGFWDFYARRVAGSCQGSVRGMIVLWMIVGGVEDAYMVSEGLGRVFKVGRRGW